MATDRDILPDADNTRSWGSAALCWKDWFVKGVISDGTNSKSVSDLMLNPNESAQDITSSSNELDIDTDYAVNAHVLTESTELQVPDFSALANGTIYRGDLYIKKDTGFTLTFDSLWMFSTGTAPTMSTTAGDVDHMVISIVKTAALGTISTIGMAEEAVDNA